ncbi:MAG: hypothetical protein R2809_13000 [Flavobacteriales bacterium]
MPLYLILIGENLKSPQPNFVLFSCVKRITSVEKNQYAVGRGVTLHPKINILLHLSYYPSTDIIIHQLIRYYAAFDDDVFFFDQLPSKQLQSRRMVRRSAAQNQMN